MSKNTNIISLFVVILLNVSITSSLKMGINLDNKNGNTFNNDELKWVFMGLIGGVIITIITLMLCVICVYHCCIKPSSKKYEPIYQHSSDSDVSEI
mmetsp:Transcript_97395/g.119308  ORF Transcript_97395/g.119308 Transcript_97395/m.119308 type:complete len:96 (+) Transcript_97395:22-309(+)